MPVEVYFNDLPKRLQNKILKYYKIKAPEEKSFEYVPIFVLKDGPDDKFIEEPKKDVIQAVSEKQ